MAGDYIIIRDAIWEDPRVLRISRLLSSPPPHPQPPQHLPQPPDPPPAGPDPNPETATAAAEGATDNGEDRRIFGAKSAQNRRSAALECAATCAEAAQRVTVSPDFVVGLLARFWCWAGRSTADGWIAGADSGDVDRMFLPGFAAALAAVGWLEETPQGVYLPNFTEWNGQSAKRRISEASRKRAYNAARNDFDRQSGGAKSAQNRRSAAPVLRSTETETDTLVKKKTSGRNPPEFDQPTGRPAGPAAGYFSSDGAYAGAGGNGKDRRHRRPEGGPEDVDAEDQPQRSAPAESDPGDDRPLTAPLKRALAAIRSRIKDHDRQPKGMLVAEYLAAVGCDVSFRSFVDRQIRERGIHTNSLLFARFMRTLAQYEIARQRDKDPVGPGWLRRALQRGGYID